MSARGWGLAISVAVLVTTGCHYIFDAEGTQCDSTGGCPTGFSCAADGLCHAARDGSGGGGGGSSDSGTGGGVDGGETIDGGADDGGADDGGLNDGGSGLCDCSRAECDGLPCRLAASICDVAEVCTGNLCPVDAKATPGVLCAPSECRGSTREAPKTCNGSGGCIAGMSVDCSPFGCGNGVCLLSCQLSAECTPGNYCNSSNSCVAQLALSQPCTLDEECLSSQCVDGVCCNSACAGACDACNLAGFVGECSAQPQGFAGSPDCAPYKCNGSGSACPTSCASSADCVAGDYCTTPAFTCEVKKANGVMCNSAAECASDFCIDGVCCNSACGGGCNRCNAAGSCTVDVAGTPGSSPSCAPYVCNGTSAACPTACTDPAQCANSANCVGTVCGGKLGDGQSCVSLPASDCLSGFCSDGVCCNTACGGACDRCNLAITNGTCTNDVGAVDAGCGSYACGDMPACPMSCANDTACAPGHYCDGTACQVKRANGVACSLEGQCSSGKCVEGVCCNSSCGGLCQTCRLSRGASTDGTCGDVAALTDPKNGCGSYFCNGTGNCAANCAGICQAQCKAGSQCSAGNCVGLLADGFGCTQACQCTTGACNTFYADLDGDGYGDPAPHLFCGTTAPSFHTTDAGDCCDGEPNAHPGQQGFFSADSGCGNFDYDCSGMIELEFPTPGVPCRGTYACCASSDCEGCVGGARNTTPGWWGAVPACGSMGSYITGACTSLPLNVGCTGNPTFWEANCNTSAQNNVVQRCR